MKQTMIFAAAIAAVAVTQNAQAHERYSGRTHIRNAAQIRQADNDWNSGYDGHADRGRRAGTAHRSAVDNAMTWKSESWNDATVYAGHDSGSAPGFYNGGASPRPRAWCGWQMRQLVGSDPGPSFNLAANWAHWGHAGPPGIGAIVVWAHHVGRIVGQENGRWIIQSGNDGNQLRTRPQAIAGAIAIRWS
jgi:hypothetical protein